jgi:predicted ribosome quality control (RQC) complex YloA/Tae2 family protein
MDTVTKLISKIGKEKLSTQARKRISSLNNLTKSLEDLQNTISEAEDSDKSSYQEQLEELAEYKYSFEEDLEAFLTDELKDNGSQIAKEEEKNAQKLLEKQAIDLEAETARLLQEKNKPEDKKGLGIGKIILGVVVGTVFFGGYNFFKNSK